MSNDGEQRKKQARFRKKAGLSGIDRRIQLSQRHPWRIRRLHGASGELLAAADESADAFGEQGGVERLAERFVEDRAIEAARVVFIAEQADEDRLGVLGVL